MSTLQPVPTETEPVPSSRRDQFLAASSVLFARHGFKGVSIYDIGRELGLSGPALYRYFSGKEEILSELLVGTSYRLLAVAQDRLERLPDGESPLRCLIGWHIEFALRDQPLITIQFRDMDCLSEDDRRRVRRLQRQYVEVWIEEIQREVPGLPEGVARSATHCVFGLINSTPHSRQDDVEQTRVLLEEMALGALTRASGLPRFATGGPTVEVAGA